MLDAGVVAEPMQESGDERVRDWLDRQPPASLYLTAIALAELLLGFEFLRGSPRARFLMRCFEPIERSDLSTFVINLTYPGE